MEMTSSLNPVLADHIPLKQGLRPCGLQRLERSCIQARRPYSIKTRVYDRGGHLTRPTYPADHNIAPIRQGKTPCADRQG